MNSINEECKIQIFGVVVDRFSSKARKFDNSLREKVVKINCVGV